MTKPLEDVLRDACQRAIKGGELVTTTLPPLFLSVPTEAEYGDLASDVALILARGEGRHPHAVADTIVRHIDDRERILADVSVAGPGFINFRFAPGYWWARFAALAADRDGHGLAGVHADRSVGAASEPIADLDVGQARRIVLREALARLLDATGRGPAVELDEVGPVRVRRRGSSGRIEERAGELVTWRELIEAIGADATRFFLATSPSRVPLVLDADLARRRSAENPFFYVRYAEARMASLFREAAAVGLDRETIRDAEVGRLDADAELGLIRSLTELPETTELAALGGEPHRVADYLGALAADFHRYYNRHRILAEERELTRARLLLAANVEKVIGIGLRLLGVSAPDTM